MRTTQHATNNFILKAPDGMTKEICSALACTKVQYPEGVTGAVIWWTFSKEELAKVQAGEPLRLTILGSVIPPMKLEISKELE